MKHADELPRAVYLPTELQVTILVFLEKKYLKKARLIFKD